MKKTARSEGSPDCRIYTTQTYTPFVNTNNEIVCLGPGCVLKTLESIVRVSGMTAFRVIQITHYHSDSIGVIVQTGDIVLISKERVEQLVYHPTLTLVPA